MKAVSMTIQVTFDENKTDAESVASALDVLVETAMSTPGVLDEYGEVSVGGFSLPPEHVWDNNEVQFATAQTRLAERVVTRESKDPEVFDYTINLPATSDAPRVWFGLKNGEKCISLGVRSTDQEISIVVTDDAEELDEFYVKWDDEK